MEAEHYPNGVLESVSTRIVNGAYKHEDLQTDESSMGKNHGPAWCYMGGNSLVQMPLPPGRGLAWTGFVSLRSFKRTWSTAALVSQERVFEAGRSLACC